MRALEQTERTIRFVVFLGLIVVGSLLCDAVPSSGDAATVMAKLQQVQSLMSPWVYSGGDPAKVVPLLQRVDQSLRAADPDGAEQTLDQILLMITIPLVPVYTPPPGPYLTSAVPVTLATVSPAAAMVAYFQGHIYTMDQAGQQVSQITFGTSRPWEHVAVSYDRRYIVANEHPATDPSRSRVWLFDLQNGTEREVLPQFYVVGEGGVSWDRQGYIYFVGKELPSSVTTEVFRIKADGTGLARLTYSPGRPKYDVGVSQDGTAITYVVFVPDPASNTAHTEIWVSNSDGSNPRRVYTAGIAGIASAHDPELSPDNSRVVFSIMNSQVLRNYADGPDTALDLWTVVLDGTGLKRLTAPGPISMIPDWQPNGNLILYTEASEHDGYAGMAIVNADGPDQTPTQFRRDMSAAKWIPPLSQ
jgi:hypothetical protein